MVESLLRFADGRPFATGQIPYFDHPMGFPVTPRVDLPYVSGASGLPGTCTFRR